MLRTQRATMAAITFALVFFVAGAAAVLVGQEASAQQSMSVQGELLQVDTENKTLMVRTAAETPMQFRYTDDTEITGAQESAAGLATANDARVTIHYTEDADVKTATKIEVHADDAEAPAEEPAVPQEPSPQEP